MEHPNKFHRHEIRHYVSISQGCSVSPMQFSTVFLASSPDFRYLQIDIRYLSASLRMIKLVQSPPGSGSAYSYVDMNTLLRTLLSAFLNTNTHVYHQRIRRARLTHASHPHVKIPHSLRISGFLVLKGGRPAILCESVSSYQTGSYLK